MKEKRTNTKFIMPDTSHLSTKILFVMTVVLGCLLVVLFVMDKSKEENIQRFEALREGIVMTMPLQGYLTTHYREHQNWPDGASVLQAVELEKPQSVQSITVNEEGVITLTFTEAVHEGGRVHLKPMVQGDGRIRWACLGEALPEAVLPRECTMIAQ